MNINLKKIFKNPIIKEQSRMGEAAFVYDAFLGHKLPEGRDFIGEKDYLTSELVIKEIKKSKQKVVINLGDSSTSGWDSNAVTKNRTRIKQGKPLIQPFFQYKTYSDYLRDLIKKEFTVINAGVPAYTSLQVGKKLWLLLERFKQEKVKIDYTTIYCGNNDCVWNFNREEKDWVGKKIQPQKISGFKAWKKQNEIIPRISIADYKNNISAIIELCRKNNIIPILIEPITPIYWQPGTRVKNEKLSRSKKNGSEAVYKFLDEALGLWSAAMKEKKYSQLKQATLEYVREKDFVVPRIKKEYIAILREVAEKMEVALIKVNLNRVKDDIRYFIDYCHPISDANKFIAEGIAREIEQFEKGVKKDNASDVKKLEAKKMKNKIYSAKIKKTKNHGDDFELPTEHYILY